MTNIKAISGGITAVLLILCVAFTFLFCTETVSKGTVSASYRFGVYQYTLQPGFHMVNPMNSFNPLDTMQKTILFEAVSLPTKDQLTSKVDVSVQFRALGVQAETIFSDTGSLDAVMDTHMIPKVRSAIREFGKSVTNAEELFSNSAISKLQDDIHEALSSFMKNKGIEVQAVLLRNIDLPEFIDAAIQSKKEREQLAQQQIAELERYETEQQQLVKKAQSQFDAAKLEAEQQKVLADAKAYAIESEGKALAAYPGILQLRSLKTLEIMSTNPASQIYWMDSTSASPLPLMHMGKK